MARVLKALEKKGRKVFIDPQRRRRATVASVDGENLAFSLRELAFRRDHVITEKEKEDLRRWPSWSLRKWDYYPSGNLVLEITSDGVWGVKTRWKEGKRARLGQQVNSFIEGLEKAAQNIKARRAERERERLAWEERARKEEEIRLRRLEKERRLQELRQQAANWRQSHCIREFIDEVRRQALASVDVGDTETRLNAWVIWATQHAEDLDPTTRILAGFRAKSVAPGGTGAGPADMSGKGEEAVGEQKSSSGDYEKPPEGQRSATADQRPSFDRAVLYEQVWARPVQAVAKDYGMSGRGLAKTCSRLRVPVPPRGYWARVQNGHKERKPPLPRLRED
jgi:hypothetical protein